MIQLGSVNLVVKDVAAGERFYRDVVGLRVDEERTNRPDFVLLRAENCMVILQQAGAVAGASTIELGFEVDDVEAMHDRLGDKAVVQAMGWGNAIETVDPDGTRLNFYRLTPDGRPGK